MPSQAAAAQLRRDSRLCMLQPQAADLVKRLGGRRPVGHCAADGGLPPLLPPLLHLTAWGLMLASVDAADCSEVWVDIANCSGHQGAMQPCPRRRSVDGDVCGASVWVRLHVGQHFLVLLPHCRRGGSRATHSNDQEGRVTAGMTGVEAQHGVRQVG